MRSRKGFTITELMIVVAILAILSAVAVPLYKGYISDAKTTEAKNNLRTIQILEEQYFAENGVYLAGATTAALTAALPGFQPGSLLEYDYSVAIAGGGKTYTATAATKAGGNAPGPFTVTNANVTNGPNGVW